MRALNYIMNIIMVIIPFSACSSGDDGEGNDPNDQPSSVTVSFNSSITSFDSYSETYFEIPFGNENEISVFAIGSNQNERLYDSGNYADNIRYVYRNGMFSPASNGISLPKDGSSLSYYAISPYNVQNRNEMSFNVLSNQSSLTHYSKSDLLTAWSSATTSSIPYLKFEHSMSQVCIDVISDKNNKYFTPVLYVRTQSDVNVEANTYNATGNKTKVFTYYDSNTYKHYALIPPQTYSSSETFLYIGYAGLEYPIEFTNTISFVSGYQQYLWITMELDDNGNYHFIALGGQINPWNNVN